jgi:signal transduction histidine kinase
MSSDIVVDEVRRGLITVAYAAAHRPLDEGPFLKEERTLLDAIARDLSQMIAQKDFEQQKAEMRERLAHTDRLNLMGQLSASIAHEINEPLTAILGYAQLAAKCEGLPAQAGEDIGRIVATSLHAREVVRKLLLFSRKLPARAEKAAVNEVLKESLAFFEPRCKKERITIETALAADAGWVKIDPAQLRQVFSNLILNAVQAMGHGGRLALRTRPDRRRLRVVIEDDGCGMTQDIQEEMFIPFFTTKPHYQGTGLGLPVVRDIVVEADGTIRVSSTPGAGTRIDIDFPRTTRQGGGRGKAS